MTKATQQDSTVSRDKRDGSLVGLSVDAMLFTVAGAIYLTMRFDTLNHPPQLVPTQWGMSGALVLILAGYWLFDLLRERYDPGLVYLIKRILLTIAILMLVVAPTVLGIVSRAANEPHEYAHDSLIQNEYAVKLVMQGKNPYLEDYFDTPMADWPFDDVNPATSHALYHYAYMPLSFLMPLPFQAIIEDVTGWFDHRLFYLACYGLVLMLCAKLTDSFRTQQSLLIMVGLSPGLVPFLAEGRNDILVLFWLALSFYALRKDRIIWSAIALGLACATKQTAWFFVPFFLLYVSGSGAWRSRVERLWRPTLVTAFVALACAVPWLLWDHPAFIDDTLAFQSGTSEHPYPALGFGLSGVLVSAGVIEPETTVFPFWLLQLGLGLPVLLALLVRQMRTNTLNVSLQNYGFWLFLMLFLSRYGFRNQLGVGVTMLTLSAFVIPNVRVGEVRGDRDEDRWLPRPRLPVDALVITLVVLGYLCLAFDDVAWFPQLVGGDWGITAVAFLLLMFYWALDVLPLDSRLLQTRLKSGIIITFVFLLAVAPLAIAISLRASSRPHEYAHDGLIQSEYATQFFLEGRNPYVEDYHSTAMADWDFRVGDLTDNPALYHYVYFPVTFLISTPLQYVTSLLSDMQADHRLVYVACYLLLLGLIVIPINDSMAKLTILIVAGLNPLFVMYLVEGRNEAIVLLWLVWTIVALAQRQFSWSAVAFALACATKQSAWFFAPFYFLYVSREGNLAMRIGHVKTPALLFGGVLAVFVAPWLILDPGAFLGDTIGYLTGSVKHSYPINGIGLGGILVYGEWLEHTSPFPFWIFQAFIGLPLFIFLFYRQWQRNDLSTAVVNYALFVFSFSFLSKIFSANYLGPIVLLLIYGSLLPAWKASIALTRRFSESQD